MVTEVLRLTGLKGSVGALVEAGGRWAAEVSGYPGIATHAVLAGDAWLTTGDGRQVPLAAGDVVMLPIGTPHRLADDPATPGTAALPPPGGQDRTVRLGPGAVRTRILPVYYDCNHATTTRVLDELPDFLHVEGGAAGAAYLGDIVRLLGRELASPLLATTAVVDSLVDLILIQLIRAWAARHADGRPGTWLGWSGDPVVRGAVERVHADPAADWTTSTLAATLNVSRATLGRRFRAAMGRSPSDYVTQWRMDLAAVRLRDTRDPVEAVAGGVGYRSVPSFTRAFLRARGTTPGAYRHAHRSRDRPATPGPG